MKGEIAQNEEEGEEFKVEDLAAVHRVEMKNKKVKNIDENFFLKVKKLYESLGGKVDKKLNKEKKEIFLEDIKEKKKKILVLSKEIIYKRMEKISKMAIHCSLGGENDISNLIEEEKEYYYKIIESSEKYYSLTFCLNLNKNEED